MWADGSMYDGDWKDDKFDGKVVSVLIVSTIFIVFCLQGTLFYADGGEYVGEVN